MAAAEASSVHGAGADDTDRPEVPPPLPRPPAPSSRILTDGFGACRATRASHLCADDDEELEESGEDDSLVGLLLFCSNKL